MRAHGSSRGAQQLRSCHTLHARCAAARGCASVWRRRCATQAVQVAAPAPPPGPPPPLSVRYSLGLSRSVAEYRSDGSTRYQESSIDRWLIAFLTRRLANALDAPLAKETDVTFDSFRRVADQARALVPSPRPRTHSAQIARGRTPEAQHLFVVSALVALFPPVVLGALRWLISVLHALRFPVASAMAFGAVPFAGWLVGPVHVEREATAQGVAQENAVAPLWATVVVRKCRYLEASGCKSACINVCKAPTQAFFADHLGVQLTMRPNFDTKGCELCFGQAPPPLALDEALRGACFSDCAFAAERGARRVEEAPQAGCHSSLAGAQRAAASGTAEHA